MQYLVPWVMVYSANTSLYSFINYIPQVIGIIIGKILKEADDVEYEKKYYSAKTLGAFLCSPYSTP